MKRLRQRISPESVAENYIECGIDPPYLEKKWFGNEKGWGVITNERISKGSFLLEYKGEHVLHKNMVDKLKEYAKMGLSYVYEYEVSNVPFCIDATSDDGSLGRLVNDSCYFTNSTMKRLKLDTRNHLCLFALEDIPEGQEILYSYGEKDLPWHSEEREKKRLMSASVGKKRKADFDYPKSDIALTEEGDSGKSADIITSDVTSDIVFPVDEFEILPPTPTKDTSFESKKKHLLETNPSTSGEWNKIDVGETATQSVEDTTVSLYDVTNGISDMPDNISDERDVENKQHSQSFGLAIDEVYQEVMYLKKNPLPTSHKTFSASEAQHIAANVKEKDANVSIQDNVEVDNSVFENLCESMRAGNSRKAKEIFSNWLKKKELKTKTSKCPICGLSKTNLKVHAMRVHGLDNMNAKSLVSQTGQQHLSRKTSKRNHQSKVCPVSTCAKVVKRIHNHLKDTHQIKDIKIYRKLLQEAEPYIENAETESEGEDEYTESEDEDELVKDLYRSGESGYLKLAGNKVDSDSTSDEDWFAAKVSKIKRKKKAKKKSQNQEACDTKTKNESNIPPALCHTDDTQQIHNGDTPSNMSSVMVSESLQEKEDLNQDFNKNSDCTIEESAPNVEAEGIVANDNDETAHVDNNSNDGTDDYDGNADNDRVCDNVGNDDRDGNDGNIDNAIDFQLQRKELEESDDEDRDDEDEPIDATLTPWKESLLFNSFLHWLVSADGKCVPPRQAKQHMKQVVMIFQECSDNTYLISCLFDRKCIRDKWLVNIDVKRKPGTVKSYIHSLRFFYKYLLCDNECTSFQHKIPSLLVMCENWIAVYRKKVKKNRWKRDIEQLSQLFTGSEVKKLDDSELVDFCQKTIKLFKCKIKKPSLKQFANVRDYILMSLCLDNASRTGALANMTMQEFDKATCKNGQYKVAVLDHKTLATSGPAIIVFTSKLYDETTVYVQKIRNTLEGIASSGKDAVFVSWSGKKMTSSMVSAQINSFWGKAVGHSVERPRICATLVRKSAVSKVHEHRKDLKGQLANLMCHNEDTAKRIYYLQEKSANAGETSRSLRSVLRQDVQPDKEDELTQDICHHFADEIKAEKITMAKVREKIELSEQFKKCSDVAIRDKVRNIIKKSRGKSENVEEDESSDESSDDNTDGNSIASSAPSWGGKRKERVVFSSTDLQDISSVFGVLITAHEDERIRTNDFKRLLQEEKAKQLLKKFGEQTLLSKVRTERKNYLKEL